MPRPSPLSAWPSFPHQQTPTPVWPSRKIKMLQLQSSFWTGWPMFCWNKSRSFGYPSGQQGRFCTFYITKCTLFSLSGFRVRRARQEERKSGRFLGPKFLIELRFLCMVFLSCYSVYQTMLLHRHRVKFTQYQFLAFVQYSPLRHEADHITGDFTY